MIYSFLIHLTDPDYSAEDYAQAWVKASAYIQCATGARGTRLHRKIGDERTLMAIASWESKEARDAMEANPPEQVAAIIAAQTPHVRIEFVGEFDDPEWEVLPPG